MSKIFRFTPALYNTTLKGEHEITINENGKKVKTTYRLVKGDSELDVRKQRKDAEVVRFEVVGHEMVIEDETIQRFLESRPDFGRNITVFDPVAESQKKLEATRNSVNLLRNIIEFDRNKTIQVGYVLFRREALNDIKDGNIENLQNKILAKAQSEPEVVSEIINDKKNSDKLFAGLLIASGIFEVSIDERYVSWGDNGSVVVNVPTGVSALDALTDYLLSKEGKEVKQEAGLRLENKATAGKTSSRKAKAEPAEVKTETTSTEDDK